MTDLNFSETQKALAHKTNKNLRKEYCLFKLINYPLITSVGSKVASFLSKKNALPKWALKNAFFYHFCGGETLEEASKNTNFLDKNSVERVFFYSVEGNASQEERKIVKKETIKTFFTPKGKKNYSALKLTGLIPLCLLEKIQKNKTLSENERSDFSEFKKDFEEICQEAKNHKAHLMIDAEESWVQKVIDSLCLEKMKKLNKEHPTIYTTLQMYRSDKLKELERLIEEAKKHHFILGIKLVRGAYVTKENEYTLTHKKKSVLNRNKEETDTTYNKALEICFKNSGHVALFAGTHNEKSMKIFHELYQKDPPKNGNFMTSQLKGMCDHITFNLAQKGVPASKYIPYGPAEKTLPYLIRRAEENSSILGETARELKILETERKRRQH